MKTKILKETKRRFYCDECGEYHTKGEREVIVEDKKDEKNIPSIYCNDCKLHTDEPTDEGECSNCRSHNWEWDKSTWTITIEASVFAGDMEKEGVIQNAQELLNNLLDGTDFIGVNVVDAKRDV